MTNIIAIPVISIMALAFITVLTDCHSGSNGTCDGKSCKRTLGFDTKEKPSTRDSIFRINNPLLANKFNVFVESTASMDGYVSGNTDFKTCLHRLIGQVMADVLIDDKSISLNYINSKILPQYINPQQVANEKIKQFSNNLSTSSFSTAGGDRANSDIISIISTVVDSTLAGEVSMFVSDCVYSPESALDIDRALKKQQTDMLNILKNKSKSDSNFGVLLYRLVSDFHGIYYNKTNEHIKCNGNRPYFIWFFGDKSILSNVYKCISKIMSEYNANYIAGLQGYKYIPYKTLKSDHPYHYVNVKTTQDSLYTFSFIADMRTFPLSNEYIKDIKNYTCTKKKYFIKKIEEYSDSKYPSYNFKYTICVRGKKNTKVTPTEVDLSLKSMLTEKPKWISVYDDATGSDYDNGYNPVKIRTFGLKSLAEGIIDFYESPSYITFKIIIN